ncbi:ethanolamine ammonia-lyase subunit EutC [Candidatus Frankia alpina]|uniref:ethanolamine ammonia-lyase subunit EutC n=1 Tax=Candidatus Frankia alpina TaxID=2699483 RepID=UPI001F396020|nr:ethanolamine ammonia-lyase subunit EutC [Candidatus Frankia alpina]
MTPSRSSEPDAITPADAIPPADPASPDRTRPGREPEPLAVVPVELAALAERVRAVTPARVFVGRTGTSYRTANLLALRADHAAARDAVDAELDLTGAALAATTERFGLFAVHSAAADRAEYLRRPDLGRRLSDEGRAQVAARCPPGADLQVVIGDGLSAAAVATQVPALLPALLTSAAEAGWSIGQPFAVRQCRVGVMNDIGDLLHPTVIVLLIGERPGLATAESLSTYLAHRPRSGHTDADRNLLSNIHHRGITPAQAGERITGLAQAMHTLGISGVSIKEPTTVRALPTTAPPEPGPTSST